MCGRVRLDDVQLCDTHDFLVVWVSNTLHPLSRRTNNLRRAGAQALALNGAVCAAGYGDGSVKLQVHGCGYITSKSEHRAVLSACSLTHPSLSTQNLQFSGATPGPSHTIPGAFLEPFRGHLSPKLTKSSKITLDRGETGRAWYGYQTFDNKTLSFVGISASL